MLSRINGKRDQNRILGQLPPDEARRLEPFLQPVELQQGQVLFEAGHPIHHVYFMDHGIISVVSTMEDGSTIEVATKGSEGMAGLAALMGAETVPHRYHVQVAGMARRMTTAALAAELKHDTALRRLLLRYQAAFTTQIMQGVACNGLHSVEQRCCRWLLSMQDRIGSQELAITHEFLAQMLGVRRASVTAVLRPMQDDGLIRAARGKVTILDPKRLANLSCECYRVVRDEYQRLLG